MLYPFIFEPVLKERVWGGRDLERLYRKSLPHQVLVGESWEITDRPEGMSVVANGPLAGKDLRWLMEHHRSALLGSAPALGGRYPLLVKLLDAQQHLSLQVHPPAGIAERLGGEPKTEMWFVTQANPDAELFLGLRRGVDRAVFERHLRGGNLTDCIHRVHVRAGDAVFLPSGRVHALGAGVVLMEIQQNSDTTYRVFDWNRSGLDGKPRQLHLPQALASINFEDWEPGLIPASAPVGGVRSLVRSPLFSVDLIELERAEATDLPCDRSLVFGVVEGRLTVQSGAGDAELGPGAFCLVPACLGRILIKAVQPTRLLSASPGQG